MAQFFDVLLALLFPWRLLYISASYIPTTIYSLITAGDFATLFTPRLFRHAWFANFWSVVGTQIRQSQSSRAAPFISQAHGIVLDIGPGSGEWVHLFDKSKVTRVLGVEPNRDHHGALRKRVQEAGLEDVYEIVPVGVEDLGDVWVRREEVDCVVTVLCLCSVDEPKKMIDELYGYLKKGGIWIVYEHVKAFKHQSLGIQLYQDILWPTFIGGCSLTRDTWKWLQGVGSWEKFDLHEPVDQVSYSVIPHAVGVLTKGGA